MSDMFFFRVAIYQDVIGVDDTDNFDMLMKCIVDEILECSRRACESKDIQRVPSGS